MAKGINRINRINGINKIKFTKSKRRTKNKRITQSKHITQSKRITKLSLRKQGISVLGVLLCILLVTVPSKYPTNRSYRDSWDKTNISPAFNEQTERSPKMLSDFGSHFKLLQEHAWEVRKVTFSPDGKLFASAGSDGCIILWNTTTWTIIHRLQRHYYDVLALEFSPDGTKLASGGYDTKLNIWDVASGELETTWEVEPYVIVDLAYSPDGRAIAIGCGEWGNMESIVDFPTVSSPLRVLNVTTGEDVATFSGHTTVVSSVAYSPDGNRLMTGSWDGSVRMWNASSGVELMHLANHTGVVADIDVTSDGKTFATASFDNTLRIWDTLSGTLLKTFATSEKEVWAVQFVGNGSQVFAAIGDLDYYPAPNRFWEDHGPKQNASIVRWDLPTETVMDTFTQHSHIIESIALSPDGYTLASASWDWTVGIWSERAFEEDSTNGGETANEDGWTIASPESQGMNSTYLNTTFASYLETLDDLHGIVIIRNGYLVYERYFENENHRYTPRSKHILFSATKSFTSTLIGMALDRGFITNTSQKVIDFFPNYTFNNLDAQKASITLHDLLSMSSGLEWFEILGNDYISNMAYKTDAVQYILDQPMLHDPGTMYDYNSGNSHLLSAILHQTTGMTVWEFAFEYLFDPLGIAATDVVWMGDSQGNPYGGVGLFLTPRNVAKLGQLYVDNGNFNGERILSPTWINRSTQDYIGSKSVRFAGPRFPLTGYGYHWWVSENWDFYAALGYEGKDLFVLPEDNIVIVAVGERDNGDYFYLIPNVRDAILVPESNRIAGLPIEWVSLNVVVVVGLVVFLSHSKWDRRRFLTQTD